VLSRVGGDPRLVMIMILGLGLFLSMWISNVASPVVRERNYFFFLCLFWFFLGLCWSDSSSS